MQVVGVAGSVCTIRRLLLSSGTVFDPTHFLQPAPFSPCPQVQRGLTPDLPAVAAFIYAVTAARGCLCQALGPQEDQEVDVHPETSPQAQELQESPEEKKEPSTAFHTSMSPNTNLPQHPLGKKKWEDVNTKLFILFRPCISAIRLKGNLGSTTTKIIKIETPDMVYLL